MSNPVVGSSSLFEKWSQKREKGNKTEQKDANNMFAVYHTLGQLGLPQRGIQSVGAGVFVSFLLLLAEGCSKGVLTPESFQSP